MNLAQLIQHPEQLNKETLYDLRSLIALHPYYQPARILLLRNLFLLHDSSFDEELRRAALYITDRNILFQLVEAVHYQHGHVHHPTTQEDDGQENRTNQIGTNANRTVSLIDNFLDTIPSDDNKNTQGKRKPTPTDATVDYVAYLLETEQEEQQDGKDSRTVSLIDKFIINDGGNFDLKETPEYTPDIAPASATNGSGGANEEYFTETLARIYIQQGRYSKALEIIKRLNLLYPKKSRYFADQIRFLEKLIINNN